MLAEVCGSSFLLGLPDDVFAIISRSLTPRDICNLSLCCRRLCALVDSEKVWLTQCEVLGIVPRKDLIEWRRGLLSCRALCRFLVSVKPLIGIWVHQNPELGNVVSVIPGFVSVVGCRIIPQELGPLGIEDGPILWAPVFEIIGNVDGSSSFFLHGREKGNDYLYPGSVKAVDRNCNVLLLEIETRQQKSENKLMHSKSLAYNHDKEISRRVSRSNCELSRSQRALGQHEIKIPFGRLNFSDRRKLIEVVTNKVRQSLPDSASGPLFPRLRNEKQNFQKDMALLFERRSLLLQMNKLSGGYIDWEPVPELPIWPTQLQSSEIRKNLDRTNESRCSSNVDEGHQQSITKKTLRIIKHIWGRSTSMNGSRSHSKYSSSSGESKYAQLHDFLRSGDTIGLSLHACKMKLTSYRAWPNMHDSRFALYKLPMSVPKPEQEFAGLWGGTFGWPPGNPSEDKPGKALFFLLISYEEIDGTQQLIATKILEGTHYVLHPNGSAMFMVNIEEPSLDPFPWETDADSISVNVKHAFAGEGIANGYGFRYPGSKPGSLYVFQSGLLAFIWKESKAVLTLHRLNLQELLRKGEKVPALPPIANFSYLTKSYSNVFAGFSNASNCLSSPRQRNL